MHTVELKCTVPVGHSSDSFFSNPKNVRNYFSPEGTCQIINSWNDVTVTENGQKVVQYTIVLKFDDQMVANSVKQKYNNKIIHGTRVYADWYNTAESKKKKKKPQNTDPEVEDFEITLEDEMEETSYATVLSFPASSHEPVNKSSTQLLSQPRLSVSEERQISPSKSRTPSRSHSKSRTTSHSRSSSHLSRDSDSMSVSPTPRSSYREGSSRTGSTRTRSRHRVRTPSWSPPRRSTRSTSSQDSSPIRERKQERFLDPVASINDEKRSSTRSIASISDRMKYKLKSHSRAANTRLSKSRKERSLTPVHKRTYRSYRHGSSRNRRWSSADRETDAKKPNRDKKLPSTEIVSVSEVFEREAVDDSFHGDNFHGAQHHMNAFDLLQPTIERQLQSGSIASDSDSPDESGPVDFATCKAMIMKDYVERAEILTSTCNMLTSQDPSIAEHLQYSLHSSLLKYGQMYLQGILHEFQHEKK